MLLKIGPVNSRFVHLLPVIPSSGLFIGYVQLWIILPHGFKLSLGVTSQLLYPPMNNKSWCKVKEAKPRRKYRNAYFR